MTCAGSWPEPEPWMIETFFGLGASVRMIRLNSGTYLIEARVGERNALEHLRHELLGVVDKFLHRFVSLCDVCSHASTSFSAITATATEPAS